MIDRAGMSDLDLLPPPETPNVASLMLSTLAVGVAQIRETLERPAPLDIAATHALRVALRRARTVLAILHRDAPSAVLDEARRAAATLAAALRDARDWDVFLTETLPRHAPAPATAGFAALCDTAALLRNGVHARFESYRRSVTARRALSHLADLLARRGWHDGGAIAPADALAGTTLDRLHARVLRRGRRLARQDAEDRHALRLAAKRLRYALDLFTPALDDDGLASYRRRLVALQDALGHGNDRAVARHLIDAVLAATDHGDAQTAAQALRQRLDAADVDGEAHLLIIWRRFRHRPVFWRRES